MSTVMRLLVIEDVSCGDCNVVFGLEQNFNLDRRRDGRSFYCPNGHRISYRDTENDRLRREVAAKEQTIERERQRLASLRDDLRCETLSHRATKGQLTKARKRAAHGVCPVQGCGRTFQNVQAHLDKQHPEWVSEHAHEEASM